MNASITIPAEHWVLKAGTKSSKEEEVGDE